MHVADDAISTPRSPARRAGVLLIAGAVSFLSGFGSGPAEVSAGRVVAEYPTVEIASLPVHRSSDPVVTKSLDAPPASGLTVVTKGALRSGQSLSTALRGQGIEPAIVHVIDRRMGKVFDFRHARPGDRYRLTQNAQGELLSFRYWPDPDKSFRLVRVGDDYRVTVEEVELHPRRARIAGLIQTSLYDAIRSLGEQPQLAREFADLFAWDIDFSRGVRPGDDFQILYERLYRVDDDGVETYVRPGRILAARYRNDEGEHSAFWFEEEGSDGSYYRWDGSSLERAFLAAPLQFSRISSNFASSRLHPILNIRRPHYGIDYAAPEGTPIWAVADGTIIYRGWGGSFGNLVKIRHANGFVSYYSHLSAFEKGLHVGDRVEQKQVIGRVGHTGLATGPHVCFRVTKDGRYVNPLTISGPAGKSVSDELWVDFQTKRDVLISALDGDALASTEEAL